MGRLLDSDDVFEYLTKHVTWLSSSEELKKALESIPPAKVSDKEYINKPSCTGCKAPKEDCTNCIINNGKYNNRKAV